MSERVRNGVSGAQMNKQFDSIRQGGYIRTTPTSSPRSSTIQRSYDTEARSLASTKSPVTASRALPEAGLVQVDEELEGVSVTLTSQSPFQRSPEGTTKSVENRRTTTTRPPPILKKLSSGSNPSSKSLSVLSPASQEIWSTAGAGNEEAVTFDDDSTPTESPAPIAEKPARRSTTTRFNEEVAVSIPKVSTTSRLSGGRPSAESSQRPGKRNPIVVASTGASKRRPPVMRQKSSQAASFGVSKDAPSRSSSSPNLVRSMKPTYINTARSPGQEAEASSARRSRAASPHPSKRLKESSAGATSSENTAEDLGGKDVEARELPTEPHSETKLVEEMHAERSRSLVDPGIRADFEDKTRPSNRSFTNISSFARKSVPTTATAASFQASGMLDTGPGTSTAGRNKGKEAFKNEIIPLKAPASAGPEPTAEASQPFPRTKSQLTLLLERERNRSLGHEP